MNFIVGAGTNVGIQKSTNQDSYTIKVATASGQKLAMCIVCDGMGGLEKGEVASAYIVEEMSKWFIAEIPLIVNNSQFFEIVKEQWEHLLLSMNDRLIEYGKANACNLGSTITGVLFLNEEYIVANVGDSRTYIINDTIRQITEDQSLVAYEVKHGRLTQEQAKTDPRKNVLLQCVGAVANLEVEFYRGRLNLGEELLLCSDGFRHMVSDEEMLQVLSPRINKNETIINQSIEKLIQLNMNRMETDNITAIMIKAN